MSVENVDRTIVFPVRETQLGSGSWTTMNGGCVTLRIALALDIWARIAYY